MVPFFHDFMDSYMRDLTVFPRFVVAGNTGDLLIYGISHWFDFHGPSMSVDMGCSSGLLVLHLACQNLRSVESHMAVFRSANSPAQPRYYHAHLFLGVS